MSIDVRWYSPKYGDSITNEAYEVILQYALDISPDLDLDKLQRVIPPTAYSRDMRQFSFIDSNKLITKTPSLVLWGEFTRGELRRVIVAPPPPPPPPEEFYLSYFIVSIHADTPKPRSLEAHVVQPHLRRRPDVTQAILAAEAMFLAYLAESSEKTRAGWKKLIEDKFTIEAELAEVERSIGLICTVGTDRFWNTTMGGIFDIDRAVWRRIYWLFWRLVRSQERFSSERVMTDEEEILIGKRLKNLRDEVIVGDTDCQEELSGFSLEPLEPSS